MTPLARVLAAIPSAKKNAAGWVARCPAHEDTNPSLSITIGDAGRVLLKCHAGCDTNAVVAAAGLAMADLFDAASSNVTHPTVADTYRYCDEQGIHLFDVIRLEPKAFRQRAASGAWSLKGIRRVPYRLPQLIAGVKSDRTVFVTEGEKDVGALVGLGLVATTCPGGADKWKPEFNEHFRGARIVVLPDNDVAGRAHGRDVAAQLFAVAKEVRIIELPDLPPKGDVSDWLSQGGTVAELKKLVKATGALTAAPVVDIAPAIPISPMAELDDDSPLASTPTLDSAALAGPLGALVHLIEQHTESHPAGILFATLSAVGAWIGRSPYLLIDGTRHYCGLFAVLVGPTSDGRKGTTVRWARRIIRDLDVDFDRKNVAGGLSSGEGVIYRVRDGSLPAEGEKKGDAGVIDKRLLIVADELGGAFRKMSGRENTLGHVLREAWDGGTLRTLTRNDPLTATDPHVALIGSITPEELRAVSTDTDFSSGTLNRFLFAWVERTCSLPHGDDPDADAFAHLIAQLGRNLATARCVGRMELDATARDWWALAYEGLTRGRPGRLGQATRRAAPYVKRLAMLYALTQGRPIVTVADLDAARAAWQYADDSAAFIFGVSEMPPLERQLIDALEAAGSDGLTRTMIRSDVVKSNNVPGTKIAAALAHLRDAGLIRSRPLPTAGRSAEVWITVRHALRTAGRYGIYGKDGNEGREGGEVLSHNSHLSHTSGSAEAGVLPLEAIATLISTGGITEPARAKLI